MYDFAVLGGDLRQFYMAKQLAFKGYSVITYGIASEVLNDFVKYEAKHLGKYSNSTYNAKWATMPITHNEILKMEGLLVQNENWK